MNTWLVLKHIYFRRNVHVIIEGAVVKTYLHTSVRYCSCSDTALWVSLGVETQSTIFTRECIRIEGYADFDQIRLWFAIPND